MLTSINKTPTRQEAEKIIKELTTKGALCWSKHSKDRMIERGITTPQIINCLSKGRVSEDPFFSPRNGGGYETSIEKYSCGEWLKIVVCIKLDEKLLIITVY